MLRDEDGRALVRGLLLRGGYSAKAIEAGMAAFDRGESAAQCQEETRRAEREFRAGRNLDVPERLRSSLWLPARMR